MKNQSLEKTTKTSASFSHSLILIAVKETYLFLVHLYGLVVHPFKTTFRILRKPDWSQTILVFGLPIYLWLIGAFFFLPVFFVFRNHYDARILLLLLFYLFTLFLFFIGLYLFFWLWQFFRKCR